MKKTTMIKASLLALCACLSVGAFAGEEIAMGNGNTNSSCSKLSSNEQSFANSLSDKNRKMFCEKFSSSQRNDAMNWSNNNNMSNDAAVEKMMKDNNMSYPW